MSPTSPAKSAVVIVLVSSVLSVGAGLMLVSGENPLVGILGSLFVGWVTVIMILNAARELAVQKINRREVGVEPDPGD